MTSQHQIRQTTGQLGQLESNLLAVEANAKKLRGTAAFFWNRARRLNQLGQQPAG